MRYLSVVLILVSSLLGAGWEDNLEKLLVAEDSNSQERLIERIVRAEPSHLEVSEYLKDLEFPKVETGKLHLRKTTCMDGVQRSWILYVPTGYDPTKQTPLFIDLHGGVSRREPIPDTQAVNHMEDNLFYNLAEANGWFFLFPFGQEGSTWWDSVGMANVNKLVRTVKQEYNVDDDRVWMGGYSDGASGAFVFGMVDPTDFAAFLALSGHIGVGSLAGGLRTYAVNLANTTTYAVTSFEDELYPSARMRPTIRMAVDAGADILYREQDGHHDFSYAADEAPNLVNFLKRHPRDPFPPEITWETAEQEFGLCRWFAIREIDTTVAPASWHTDHNVTLTDDRVTIGFNVAEHQGQGVKVGKVFEETAAFGMGLETEDVIIGAQGAEISGLEDLNAYKSTKSRGDSVQLTVLRDDREIVLYGQLPEPEDYYVFDHQVPSARAKASFLANRIEVRGSRVGAFSILVHPDMIRLKRPLVVTYNGEEVYNQKVEPDICFMLRNYLANRDRKLLYVAKVEIMI